MTPIIILSFIILSLIGVPLAIGSGVATIIGLLVHEPKILNTVMIRMIDSTDSFPLLAIPLFIMCGNLMNTSGITDRIFTFARCIVGHVRGGLGHANVLASIIFAGMSGAALADAGGLGQVEIKAMKDQGYDSAFAAAVTAASATIGPIIPPSVPIIIFASIAEESIGRLFLGGIVPGFMMGGMLMALIYYIAKKKNFPRDKPAGHKDITTAFVRAILPMLTPVIILGGMMSGVFTATEGAAVASLYALFLGGIVYREIKATDLPRIMVETLSVTAITLFILATISTVAWVLVKEDITGQVSGTILSITREPLLVLFLINIFLITLGTLLETLPIMVLTIPIFMPLITEVGIDPIHFGIVMILNLMIGSISPPIGMLLFITSRVSGVKLEKLMVSILPFLLPLTFVLVLITCIPSLVLWIPNMFF